MRTKIKDVRKTTLSFDERSRVLLDALARLNRSSVTALIEEWTQEKAIEAGLIEPEIERERIIAAWKKMQAGSKGKGNTPKVDPGSVEAALKRMPPPKARSKTRG